MRNLELYAMLFYLAAKQREYLLLSFLIIAAIVFGISMFSGKIDAFNTVLSRFEEADVSALTTGRTGLWADYMSFLWDNKLVLFFGVGFGGNYVDAKAAHNTYIDLLYYMGVVGTVIFILVMAAILKAGNRLKEKSWLNNSVVLGVAVMYFSLSELFYFDWAFHIVIAVLVSGTNMSSLAESE